MQLYSKGDTLELFRGDIALVLNSGIQGIEFCREYKGKRVHLFSNVLGKFIYIMIMDIHRLTSVDTPGHEDHVYYSILIGDVKGWVTEIALEKWKRNKL